MDYSKSLAYKWQMILDSYDLDYSFDTEKGYFVIPDFSIDNEVRELTIYITCRDSDFKIWCSYDMKVPERYRDQMSVLLTKINYSMYFGRYFMDYSDGEMGFKYAVDFEGGIASAQMLKNALLFVVNAPKDWGNAMVAVAKGRMSGISAYSKYLKD